MLGSIISNKILTKTQDSHRFVTIFIQSCEKTDGLAIINLIAVKYQFDNFESGIIQDLTYPIHAFIVQTDLIVRQVKLMNIAIDASQYFETSLRVKAV